MSRRLRSRLLGIGRAAATRSSSGGIRFFALALASLSLALSAVAVTAALAVDTARDGRMSGGQLIEATRPGATTSIRMAIDHLQGGRQYAVVFVSPASDDAPLPPGLDEWPEPGTAVVSPELFREGIDQGISGRYGELAGTIGESGLADATELLAYVRPAQDLDPGENPGVVAVSGFGGSGPVVPGQNLHWLLADQDFLDGTVAAVLVALGVIPSVLLALVAAKVASHSRDRRDALITALGGRVAHRLWIAVGEAWAPVSLGALGAVAVVAWFSAADRRLPIVDYVVSSVDIRGRWWAFGLCAVAAAVFVLCTAVLRSAAGAFGVSGNRPLRALGRRTHRMRVALFPCFVLLAAVGPYFFPDHHPAHILTGYTGLVGTVLTMPTAIGAGVAALGRRLALLGHRRREAALLTSGRRMTHRPDAVTRQVFGVCACIFFFLFALTMQGNFASNAEEAGTFVDEHGYALVEVHPRGQVAASEVDEFVAAVPDGIEVVAYTKSVDEGRVRVTGACPALTTLALPCAEERVTPTAQALAAWLRSASEGEAALTVAPGDPSAALEEGSISLLAVSVNGADIAAGVLNNAGVVFPFGVATSVPGETWYVGAVPSQEQSGWLALIGGFGLVVLIFATGLGLAGEFLRFGRAIAPVSVLAGNRRIYWRASALVSLLPLTAAVAGGFLIGFPAVHPLATTDVNLITPNFIALYCGAALVAGIVVWLWSATAAVNSANRWQPGRGDD